VLNATAKQPLALIRRGRPCSSRKLDLTALGAPPERITPPGNRFKQPSSRFQARRSRAGLRQLINTNERRGLVFGSDDLITSNCLMELPPGSAQAMPWALYMLRSMLRAKFPAPSPSTLLMLLAGCRHGCGHQKGAAGQRESSSTSAWVTDATAWSAPSWGGPFFGEATAQGIT